METQSGGAETNHEVVKGEPESDHQNESGDGQDEDNQEGEEEIEDSLDDHGKLAKSSDNDKESFSGRVRSLSSRSGITRRGAGYTTDEVNFLLSNIAEILPTTSQDWFLIEKKHYLMWPDHNRSAGSLRKKFRKLYNVRTPATSTPSYPPSVRMAKDIFRKLLEKSGTGDVGQIKIEDDPSELIVDEDSGVGIVTAPTNSGGGHGHAAGLVPGSIKEDLVTGSSETNEGVASNKPPSSSSSLSLSLQPHVGGNQVLSSMFELFQAQLSQNQRWREEDEKQREQERIEERKLREEERAELQRRREEARENERRRWEEERELRREEMRMHRDMMMMMMNHISGGNKSSSISPPMPPTAPPVPPVPPTSSSNPRHESV